MKFNLISEINRRYFLVLGAFLIHLSLGSFYNFGNIQGKIVEYMQNYSSSKNVDWDSTHWIYGTMVFGLGASTSLGGYIENKIGPSITVLIGGFISSFNVCLMLITLKTYLFVVVISYGLISGFGMGIAYGVALGVPIKWFPNNRGLIFGIAVSGFGISATIFDSLQHSMLYFNNKKYIQNLPKSFFILGIIFAFLQILGSVLIAFGPQINETKTTDNSTQTENERCTLFQNSVNYETDFEPHQILLEFDFWILWIIQFLTSFWIYFITQVYSRYWKYLTGDKDLASHLIIVSIVASVSNFCGRIVWGYAIDKKPFKMIMLINTLPSALFIGTFQVLSNERGHWINFIFGLWIVIIYFFFSGIFSIFPAMCAKLFGMKNFVKNYGMLFTSCSISGFVVSIVIMTVLPKTNKDLKILNTLFYIGSGVLILAALITMLFRGKSLIARSTQFSLI